MFDKYVWPYRKAFMAAFLAGLAVLYANSSGGLTGQEWLEALVAAVATAGGVWGIKNAPVPPKQ